MGLNDINSLSHTRWNCKYHIVFAPKYRRKVFYQEKKAAIGKILRQLCEWKGVKIIEAEACPNHIHLFVEIPPKISVSHFMGYLKGKSSTMLYEQFGELKYKYRNREFWCRGYYVDTVGKNESRIAEYVRNQLKEDEMGEQLRIPSNSPFTGAGRPYYALHASARNKGLCPHSDNHQLRWWMCSLTAWMSGRRVWPWLTGIRSISSGRQILDIPFHA